MTSSSETTTEIGIKRAEIKEQYKKFTGRKVSFILSCIAALFLIASISTTLGSFPITVTEVYSIIYHGFFQSPETTKEFVVWNLRLPRILMAIVAGTGLAIAGTTFQSILRNPLASPYTLGIASGAGFGAALAIVLGAGVIGYQGTKYISGAEWMVVTNAFIFAMLSALVIVGISKYKRATPATMILAGISIMYLFSASISFLQYIASESALASVVYWMFGSLSKANWPKLGIVSCVTFALLVPLLKWSWDLNTLAAGDEVAKSLGVNVERIRLSGMVVGSFITATAVAFLGIIGFIGLVAPHIARMVIGGDHRFLLPASCIVGAILLLAAETVAHNLLSPIIIPVGIITAFLGVPLFLYLILTRSKEYW